MARRKTVPINVEAIKLAMAEKGYNQSRLADEMGVSPTVVSKILLGVQECDAFYLKFMANILEKPEEALMYCPVNRKEAKSDIQSILSNNEVLTRLNAVESEIQSLTEDIKIMSLMVSTLEKNLKAVADHMESIEVMDTRTAEMNGTLNRLWGQMKPKATVKTYERRNEA